MKIEQNDTIAIIDGRPELKFIKGQNQRTFEIGTFPRNILEVLRFNRHGTLNTISRPVHGSFQHTAHGSADTVGGPSWGVPSYLDSSYNGANVQLRQKSADQVSKNARQQKAISEHFVKEKKNVANKQFSYNKLVNENRMTTEHATMSQQMRQHSMKNQRQKPARPPLPSMQPTEGILIDLSPEEIRSMNMTLKSQASGNAGMQVGCLLDEPIDIPTELELEEQQQSEEQQLQRMPPPYPMPPSHSIYSNSHLPYDPFDTTHIAPVENLYANSSVQLGEPIYNNHPSQYAAATTSSASLNELLSASLASLSITTSNSNPNENINGQAVTPKRVEKQTLAEQLQSASGTKENTPVKVNLEQRMNMQVPMTRNYDFTPQASNYSNYVTQSDVRSMHYDSNIYNSVAGDPIYAENFYDAVQSQTPSVIYESTASVYNMQQQQQQQQAIYDEVAAYEDVAAWRPQSAVLRPAPAPPAQSSPLLSQQQIYRRLEKINQQYGRVAELMNTLSMDNMTEEEAKDALEAANWNQDLATRHFKIERLSK